MAESGRLPEIDERELVFGIPQYRIINAAFCHSDEKGARFSSSGRGAWYAGFEVETSVAEVLFRKQHWLEETRWDQEEFAEYIDYLADFRAQFHDLRGTKEHTNCLSPSLDYTVPQALAAQLLALGSAGIVYPSVRRAGGTCIACFRPVLVTSVRKGNVFKFVFQPGAAPRQIFS